MDEIMDEEERQEEIHFFCNICGGPPTYKRLIKWTSLPFLHEEDELDDDDTYDDFCTCGGEREQVGSASIRDQKTNKILRQRTNTKSSEVMGSSAERTSDTMRGMSV
jgi:hypothetical protein